MLFVVATNYGQTNRRELQHIGKGAPDEGAIFVLLLKLGRMNKYLIAANIK